MKVDTRFYDIHSPLSMGKLLELTHAEFLLSSQSPDVEIDHVSPLKGAGSGALCFLESKKDLPSLQDCRATVCLVHKRYADFVHDAGILPLISSSPRGSFGLILEALYTLKTFHAQTASIHPSVKIGHGVRLGPGVVIGEGAEIGDQCHIGPNSVIGPGVVLGEKSVLGYGVSAQCALIGKKVHIGARTVIGESGFAIALTPQGPKDLFHPGRVVLGDHVSLGAGVTVDRGFLEDTVLEDHVKIDNLSQIAHNVCIGKGTVIAAMSGISGSVRIGRGVLIGGNVGIADHIRIGDHAVLAARSGVMNSVPPRETWGGFPAKPVKQWLREVSLLKEQSKPQKRKKGSF